MAPQRCAQGAGQYLSAQTPPYAPELNPIEHVWDELREKFFHNRVFKSLDALEDHLAHALKTLEDNPTTVDSIVSWPWIVGAFMFHL